MRGFDSTPLPQCNHVMCLRRDPAKLNPASWVLHPILSKGGLGLLNMCCVEIVSLPLTLTLSLTQSFRGTPCYTQSRHTLESLASPEDSSWIVSDQHATELLEGLLVKEARNRLTAAQVLQQVFVELPATLEDTSPCVAAMLQMQSSPIMNMSGIQGLPGILPAQPSVLPMAPPIPRAVPSANLGREQQQEMKQLQHRVTELQSQCKDASDKQLKAIRSLEVKVGDPVATSSTCSIS